MSTGTTRTEDPLRLVDPLVSAALAEDVGSGDATSLATIPEGTQGEGVIVAKATGTLCGVPVARKVFAEVDPSVIFEADCEEGARVEPGDPVIRVRGSARSILTAERTALNFLQHLSGIASATARAVAALEGTGTRVLDTRKTVPGMRVLAKYAVRTGGGVNHRMRLDDLILIKENHIEAAGGIEVAVRRARERFPNLAVEVEVTDLDELDLSLATGVDRVMLDNFDEPTLVKGLARIEHWVAGGEGRRRPEVELSGGITPDTVKRFARRGVDFISSGSLTHSARALDLSLRLRLLDS